MKIFRRLFHSAFHSARQRHRHKVIESFALLGYKLNSYHFFPATIRNLLTDQDEQVVIHNQFVPSEIRHATRSLKVGFWRIRAERLRNFACVASADFFGDSTILNGLIDFYFPLDLTDEYPSFTQQLGAPDQVIDGILNPSGRSIWLCPQGGEPVCLKIDTLQLEKRRYFSERALLPLGAMHSISVSNYLNDDIYAATEDRAANIVFRFAYTDGQPKRYTYLLRSYDFKKLDIRNYDFLVPMVALLSPDLWSNEALVKSLDITRSAVDLIEGDLASCFAALIKNSLSRTFLHFEVHQQNLSLHLRKGRGVKLIYHDLQDTVFDTVTYFLDQFQRRGFKEVAAYYHQAAIFQKTNFLNSHGYVLLEGRPTREYFTVVTAYRRYLRNFGIYNKTLSYFVNLAKQQATGEAHDPLRYLADKTFEARVLRVLDFSESDLRIDEVDFTDENEKQFLTNDLFWSIQRFHQVFQKNRLQHFIETVHRDNLPSEEIATTSLKTLLQTKTTVASNGFPVSVTDITEGKIKRVRGFYENRVLLVTYGNEDYLLVVF